MHIQNVIQKYKEQFGCEYSFDNPLTGTNQTIKFLLTSHLDYLKAQQKRLEGKKKIPVVIPHYSPYLSGFNEAIEEELFLLQAEIKETEALLV
jgi:hypothetical protein